MRGGDGRDPAVMALLLDAGADWAAQVDGKTLLGLALAHRNVGMVKFLLTVEPIWSDADAAAARQLREERGASAAASGTAVSS
jgi:hypothetical protein